MVVAATISFHLAYLHLDHSVGVGKACVVRSMAPLHIDSNAVASAVVAVNTPEMMVLVARG